MIKAVIFDMDGVLVDADKWHYNALNVALQHADVDPISWQEHLTVYKGIPTREKLRILTERKGLDPELWDLVSKTKQDVTQQIIESFSTPDGEKIEMLRLLSRRYPIVVCSNSIRAHRRRDARRRRPHRVHRLHALERGHRALEARPARSTSPPSSGSACGPTSAS